MRDASEFKQSGARPPVAPAIGQGAAPAPLFPGITKPTVDMQAVRDGRRSLPLQYIVDLSSARSFAAGTALLLPLQGNVFHSDPLFDLTGATQAGVARVHFQDENINPVGTYVTALPSAIYKIPFTQVAIENYAQAGKFLSIIYGMDIDLEPGASQQVQATVLNSPLTVGGTLAALAQQAVGGVNALVTTPRGVNPGANFVSNGVIAAGATTQVFSPASNVNGAIVWDSDFTTVSAALNVLSLLAKASAPGTVVDGVMVNYVLMEAVNVAKRSLRLPNPRFIAAGLGLYFISQSLETNSVKSVDYTLL